MNDHPTTSHNNRYLEASWALVLTVIAAYLYVLIAARGEYTPAELAANIGLGLVYLGWSFIQPWLDRRVGRRVGRFIYLPVASVLVIAIQWLGHGLLWLVMLPLIVQAVFDLPRLVWFSFTAVLTVLAFVLPLRVVANMSWTAVLETTITFLPALIFVVAISRIWAREHAARAEVERLAAELSQANRQLREYAAQAEELATTKERNRLAREIHDTLGHYLTVINVQLEAAQAVRETDPPRSNAAIAKAQILAKDGLSEVRRSVAALRALPVENRPLAEAIGLLAEECRAAGLVVEYQVQGPPRRLALPTEMALYRAAQEALTNTRKHARASRVNLTLDYAPANQVRLTVQDNGVGAAVDDSGEGRFGLLGVRERAHLLGGEVQILSAPGKGFCLEVSVPQETANAE